MSIALKTTTNKLRTIIAIIREWRTK